MVDMDWSAAMSSEIFREYVKNETTRMETEKQAQLKTNAEDDNILEEFERELRSSPKKLATFRALQKKFAMDPEYAERCKPEFVTAVMMLNLD